MRKTTLLTIILIVYFSLNVRATTYTFTGAGSDNNWSNAANWHMPPGGPPTTGMLVSGDDIIINSGCRLDVNFTLPAGVTLTTIDNKNFRIANGSIFTNNGNIINNGDIINNGIFINNSTINNTAAGTVENNNIITNSTGATFDNYGSVTNKPPGGTITNSGTINNNTGATITNNSTITNSNGTFNNDGTFNGTGNGSLPITLTRFDATQVANTIVLKWETASEKDNAYMEVQRSKDGIHFISLHQEKGYGTTSELKQYKWVDPLPFQGLNYYRLKQIDYEGKWEYHPIAAVDFKGKGANAGIYLYPTEVRSRLTIALETPTSENAALLVVDALGRVVHRQGLGIGTIQEDMQLQDLPSGYYFITLQSGNSLQTARFLKINN